VVLGLLESYSESGQNVGDQVDGEDLAGSERGSEAEHARPDL
jgi:hypothetical protein